MYLFSSRFSPPLFFFLPLVCLLFISVFSPFLSSFFTWLCWSLFCSSFLVLSIPPSSWSFRLFLSFPFFAFFSSPFALLLLSFAGFHSSLHSPPPWVCLSLSLPWSKWLSFVPVFLLPPCCFSLLRSRFLPRFFFRSFGDFFPFLWRPGTSFSLVPCLSPLPLP